MQLKVPKRQITKWLKYFCDLAKIFLSIRKGDTKLDIFAHCVLGTMNDDTYVQIEKLVLTKAPCHVSKGENILSLTKLSAVV